MLIKLQIYQKEENTNRYEHRALKHAEGYEHVKQNP